MNLNLNPFLTLCLFGGMLGIALALLFSSLEIHDLHNSVNALSATVNEMRR